MKKKALISVYQKEGVLALAAFLRDAGWEILSTGGTAAYMRNAGIAVTDVCEVTGFPECLDGRVKTLHPALHAGILARRGESAHVQTLQSLNLDFIDLVCVNLYPFFEKAAENLPFEQTIEFIDIGGPAMLRSAAKNFKDVLALTDSADYPAVMHEIKSGAADIALRTKLAAKVFNLCAAYDAAISCYLREKSEAQEGEAVFPRYWQVPLEKAASLRYGENGHQHAAFYGVPGKAGAVKDMAILNGKALSYNNIRDTDLAWKAVCSFGLGVDNADPLGEAELCKLTGITTAAGKSCVAVKHNTPCGAGCGGSAFEAFLKAKACDPVSIFGGIVAFNCPVDLQTAEALNGLFLEIVAAPDFTPDALDALKQKKNLRVLRIGIAPKDRYEWVSVDGGALVQESSRRLFEKWEVPTKAAPDAALFADMVFGLRAVSWVKSNAIALVKEGALLGVGGGETNRIWAAELAINRAAERAAALAKDSAYAPLSAALRDGAKPAVLASDAFFPFSDVVELAALHGIRAIIQCGGSANDALSIEACNKHGIAMVFTGIRCFKH